MPANQELCVNKATQIKMNLRPQKTLKVLGLFGLCFLIIAAGSGCWITRTENDCWEYEATVAFMKYGSLKTRADILRTAGIEKDPGTNPIEVIEKDPNGCSFGSNGQTVIRFTFNNKNELTKIQVFRNYIASGYKMEIINEQKLHD